MLAVAVGSFLAAPTLLGLAGLGLPGGVRVHGGQTVVAPAHSSGVVAPDPGAGSSSVRPPDPVVDGPVDGVDFELILPSLGYHASVLEGTGDDVLARGPGHYPTTAWPGRAGNVGVAAHNTYWLGLGKLKPGDRVEIRTPHGYFAYAITGIRVVNPDDLTVLAPTTDHRLTLTTCYPLWAGAWATQRLIFSAVEVAGVA